MDSLSPSNFPPAIPSGQAVDPRVIQSLQGTKPWVRLCSVIGFISSGLMLIGAFFMLIAGAALGGIGTFQPQGAHQEVAKSALPFAGFQIVIAILYGLIGVLYLFPSLKLWKYGSAILRLMSSGSPDDLADALDLQRAFWKFVGIMILAMIALYLVMIVVMVAVFAFGALAAGSH